jgi:hypothetical protein
MIMKKIVLIACSSKKGPTRARAKDLYSSPLFIKSHHYARKMQPDLVFILSAKYGLTALDRVIDPYDITLKRMSAAQIKDWSTGVLVELSRHTDLDRDRFIFLAGSLYRKYLKDKLRFCEVPMEGMTIGRQLQFLGREVS